MNSNADESASEMIITIDGPAGAGKSTVARGLAARLGFEFLDTGAMYRAVAWACLEQSVRLDDRDRVAQVAADLTLDMEPGSIVCNGQDISEAIRMGHVSQAASRVAAIPAVRHELVRLQREIAAGRNMVTEGRDQGTVVFPDAECKIFLTADPKQRAERRLNELAARGQTSTLDEVLAEIVDRDERDRTREVAPLVPANDAIEVDSSGLDADGVIACIEELVRERRSAQSSAHSRPDSSE